MSADGDSETLPRIARYKPFYAELEAGKSYFWCACGRSRNQPFCDGSHKGTGINPVRYKCETDGEEVLFCGCKHSKAAPFCDGAHNNLRDAYDEDDPDSPENRAIPEVDKDADGKARLDGGCFVAHVGDLASRTQGTLTVARAIGEEDGAIWQSHFRVEAAAGRSPVMSFGARHCILLVTEGSGVVEIGDRSFEVAPEMGIYARPGEALRIETNEGLSLNAAVCPLADWPDFPSAKANNFDAAFPERRVRIDPVNRQAMADRFFQILVDKSVGSDMATQFIGEIPLSKAAPHRHLYEESLVVLRGAGMMWTEARKTPVRTGDVIFLPRKQIHSLQCTDPGGMLLAGVIYPGDNPSINY